MTCCPSPYLNPSKVVSVVEWILAACFAQQNQLAAGRHCSRAQLQQGDIAPGRICSQADLQQAEIAAKPTCSRATLQQGDIAAGHNCSRATLQQGEFAAWRQAVRRQAGRRHAAGRHCNRANLQPDGRQSGDIVAGHNCSRATLQQCEFAARRTLQLGCAVRQVTTAPSRHVRIFV